MTFAFCAHPTPLRSWWFKRPVQSWCCTSSLSFQFKVPTSWTILEEIPAIGIPSTIITCCKWPKQAPLLIHQPIGKTSMPPTSLVSCRFGTTIVQQPRAWNLDDLWDLASKQDPSAYGKLRLQRPSDQKTARWWLTYSLICICWDTYVRMIMCTAWYVIISRILHVKIMPSAVWSGSHHALAPANERLIYPSFCQFRSAGIPYDRRLQKWIMPCEDLVACTGTGQRSVSATVNR